MSTSDSSIFFVDTVGNSVSKIKMNSLVRSVSVSPDNLLLVAGCTDNNLYVFDNQNELISTLKGHSGEVINCSFSEDGQKIISTGLDNKIIVWDITGKILALHTNVVEKGFESGLIELACFSPESQLVLYVMNDYYHQNYAVKIWDWNKNEIISKLDFFTTDISSAQFISDNQVLITAQNKAFISDFSNQQNQMLIGHTKLVFDARFDKKNDVIYTVSLDKTIKSWKIFNYSEILNKFKFVDAVSISNSSSIYSVFADNKLDVFSASKNYFSKIPKSSVLAINFSENDNFITTTNIDSSFTLWEKDGKIRTNIKLKNSVLYAEYSEMQNSIIVVTSNSVSFYKPDSTLVNTIDATGINHFDVSFEQNIIAYITGNEMFIKDFNGNVVISETFENIIKLKFFDDGRKLMLSSNEAIYLSDKKFGNFKEIITPKSTLTDISNSGKFIVWADNENNCRLLTNKGEEIYNFKNNNNIVDIQFSSNEKTLITKTVDNFGKTELNLWFISIPDIIEYVNDIKLFGEVYNPDIEELRKISNQEGSSF
ncbi:MAG: hypothetical protein JXL97_09310 [Bacteroidales bacterium]|nr:hypothetical protein [Bacteroidales bacterium]